MMMCKVCSDQDVSAVLKPCGHLVCCNTCALSQSICPVCPILVSGFELVYL